MYVIQYNTIQYNRKTPLTPHTVRRKTMGKTREEWGKTSRTWGFTK